MLEIITFFLVEIPKTCAASSTRAIESCLDQGFLLQEWKLMQKIMRNKVSQSDYLNSCFVPLKTSPDTLILVCITRKIYGNSY